MHVDTNLLLTGEKLNLDANLIRGKTAKGTYAIKRVSSQTYVVVNELEGRVLDEFAEPHTVPEVLEACIRKRSCPALRNFYDLILKAHRAGVLRSEELAADGPAAIVRPPLRWAVPLPPMFALVLCGLAALATLAGFALRFPVLPVTWLDAVIGWAAVCASLSFGQILAACVLHSGGGEVHAPHLGWTALNPHFAFDLRDACMTERRTRAAVAATTLLPLAGAIGAGLWFKQAWTLVPVAFLFIACRPVGDSPVGRLLQLMRRRPLVDTDSGPLLDVPIGFFEQCRISWRRFDGRVAAIQGALAVTWAGAVALAVFRCLHLDPSRALLDLPPWQQLLPGIALALAAVFVLWAANGIQYDVADTVSATWRRWSVKLRRWLKGQGPLAASVDVEMLIRRNPLLRRLSPELQMELADHAKPYTARAWQKLVAFDQEPPFVALVISGAASVYRRGKSGRKTRLVRVIEGDLFGAHKLVDTQYGSLEIRTNTPLHAVTFDLAEFKRIVVDTLGAKVVRDYLHKHLFLERASELCAEWRPAAIARFAELTVTAAHAAGGKIISRGQDVANLYVLYEGRARAVQGKKSLGHIDPGDFFGEISLLQASAATADVESKEDGQCLVVNRVDFVRFMSRNHHVALQMERLCSKRLGRPVFPLEVNSFE